MKILSVLVEGGARLLQSFIDEGLWDEARIICNRQLVIGKGLPSPELESAELIEEIRIGSDEIKYFQNKK
jgi:diaminohydroxyphosphoribosylaminopyrimidine deaminase/5-amino-6-(5-phosphoribosylamino)uracil reductase